MKNKNSLYIHIRTYNEFLVIYIGSFDTPSFIFVKVNKHYFSSIICFAVSSSGRTSSSLAAHCFASATLSFCM